MRSDSKCPYCGKEYPLLRVRGLFGKDGRAIRSTRCGCDGEAEAERAAYVARRRVELGDAWAKTNVPRLFKGVTPDKDGLRLIESRGIYISGPRGTGKTARACSILKAYVARNQEGGYVSAKFISLPDWLASMRRDWGSQEEDAYQRAAGVKLLVLDDIGKGKPTAWAMERLFRLVDDRYANMRRTIYTSQYSLAELGRRCAVDGDIETAEAMVSRIYQTCEGIELSGPDLRKKD